MKAGDIVLIGDRFAKDWLYSSAVGLAGIILRERSHSYVVKAYKDGIYFSWHIRKEDCLPLRVANKEYVVKEFEV